MILQYQCLPKHTHWLRTMQQLKASHLDLDVTLDRHAGAACGDTLLPCEGDADVDVEALVQLQLLHVVAAMQHTVKRSRRDVRAGGQDAAGAAGRAGKQGCWVLANRQRRVRQVCNTEHTYVMVAVA